MKGRPGLYWFSSTSLAALSAIAVAVSEAQTPQLAQDGSKQTPVVLEPFEVTELPLLSFGISLEVTKDNDTKKVVSMRINGVCEGSGADQKGLQPRMRIDRINGRPVEEFEASFRKGSELNKVFVNRRLGDTVILDVAGLRGVGETSRVTLVEIPESIGLSPYFSTDLVVKWHVRR